MKQLIISLILGIGLLGVTQSVSAVEPDPIQQQYNQQIEQGKTFKDAYEALAYEIAYETAAVQAKNPCRKLIRGL